MKELKALKSGMQVMQRNGVLRFAKLSGHYFVTDNAGRIVYSGKVFHIAVAVARKHGIL